MRVMLKVPFQVAAFARVVSFLLEARSNEILKKHWPPMSPNRQQATKKKKKRRNLRRRAFYWANGSGLGFY